MPALSRAPRLSRTDQNKNRWRRRRRRKRRQSVSIIVVAAGAIVIRGTSRGGSSKECARAHTTTHLCETGRDGYCYVARSTAPDGNNKQEFVFRFRSAGDEPKAHGRETDSPSRVSSWMRESCISDPLLAQPCALCSTTLCGALAAQFTAPSAVAPGHAPSAASVIAAGPTSETHSSASCGQQLHCVHVDALARSPPTRALQRRRRRPPIRRRAVVGSLRRRVRLSLPLAAAEALLENLTFRKSASAREPATPRARRRGAQAHASVTTP